MSYFANQFLNDIKEGLDMEYDQELADFLGYSKPMISAIRNGKKRISEEKAMQLAQFTSFNEGQILVGLAADNAKTQEAKKTWWEVLKHIKNDDRLELKMDDMWNPNFKSVVKGMGIIGVATTLSLSLYHQEVSGEFKKPIDNELSYAVDYVK